MGNASAKDIHNAVDAGDLEKIEKILEAKIELIDALSKEVALVLLTFLIIYLSLPHFHHAFYIWYFVFFVGWSYFSGRNSHLSSMCEWEHRSCGAVA